MLFGNQAIKNTGELNILTAFCVFVRITIRLLHIPSEFDCWIPHPVQIRGSHNH